MLMKLTGAFCRTAISGNSVNLIKK